MSKPLALLAFAGIMVCLLITSMSLSALHAGLQAHNARLNEIDGRKCTMMTVLTPMGRKTICALTFEKPDNATDAIEFDANPTQGRKS